MQNRQKIKRAKYYALEDSPAIKKIDKWACENPDLAKQARLELEAEMRNYASNPIK